MLGAADIPPKLLLMNSITPEKRPDIWLLVYRRNKLRHQMQHLVDVDKGLDHLRLFPCYINTREKLQDLVNEIDHEITKGRP